jgi:hypothetical protein
VHTVSTWHADVVRGGGDESALANRRDWLAMSDARRHCVLLIHKLLPSHYRLYDEFYQRERENRLSSIDYDELPGFLKEKYDDAKGKLVRLGKPNFIIFARAHTSNFFGNGCYF